MIADLTKTIDAELDMVRELQTFILHAEQAQSSEQRLFQEAIRSTASRIQILNRSTTTLLEALTPLQALKPIEKNTGVERLRLPTRNEIVAVRAIDKDRYLEELSISESLLKKLRNRTTSVEKEVEYTRPNSYARFSNQLFLPYSQRLLAGGAFKELNADLRKANLTILSATYISMIVLSTILSFIGGLIIFLCALFVNVSLDAPFISLYTGSYLSRLTMIFWIPLILPVITFALFYFYPAIERSGLTRKIDSELPFVVIHMGSIAGSGVEPTLIFKIVGLSKDYPATRTEIRKLLNQVNVYGYDLITALKNVARLTPSQRLSELFNGLATTISSGGDLKTFFEKRAESLLLQYRIEREKFTKVAETFMDLYISIVIAAPMILLLLLVMISVSGVSIGVSQSQMSLLIIVIVALINVVFLWVISLKQPAY